MSLANAFSAGLFLAIALVHIIPETVHKFEIWAKVTDGITKHFPLPFVLAFTGYTFILLIDRVMFDSHSIFADHGHRTKSRQGSLLKDNDEEKQLLGEQELEE